MKRGMCVPNFTASRTRWYVGLCVSELDCYRTAVSRIIGRTEMLHEDITIAGFVVGYWTESLQVMNDIDGL